MGSGEGTALVAEQLRLDEVGLGWPHDSTTTKGPPRADWPGDRVGQHALLVPVSASRRSSHRSRRARKQREQRASATRAEHATEVVVLAQRLDELLFERLEDDVGRAEDDPRAGLEIRRLDTHSVDPGPVLASEIAQERAARAVRDETVMAGDRWIGEHEVVGLGAADRQLGAVADPVVPRIRPLGDAQAKATIRSI